MKQRVGMMDEAIGAWLGLSGPAWSDQKGKERDTEEERFEMTDHLSGGLALYRFVEVARPSRADQGDVRCTA